MAQLAELDVVKLAQGRSEYDAWALMAVQQAARGGSLPLTREAQHDFSTAVMSARQRADEAARSMHALDVAGLVADARRLVDVSPAYLLDLVDTVDQALSGTVRIKINDKNEATRQRTAHLANISTREQALQHLKRLQAARTTRSLSPKYLEKRVWYIKWWVRHCLLKFGCAPWMTDMSRKQLYMEMLGSFFEEIEERYGPCGAGAQGVTHVTQWHLTVLRVELPEFKVLANDRRLAAREHRKHSKSIQTAPRRGYTPAQVKLACTDMGEISRGRPVTPKSSAPSRATRLEAAVMRFVLACAWWLILRVGELCVGGQYDPDVHWSIQWLVDAGWWQVRAGGAAVTDQMARKQDGNVQTHAFSFEPFPVLFMDLPHNPIQAFRDLRSLFPVGPEQGHFAAHALSASGLPPAETSAVAYLKAQGRRLWPLEAEYMDWTGHCACIGAITALQDLGHGDTVLNHMACKSLTSGTSELYKLRTMGAMCRAQAHMATADVTIIRDTFGSQAAAARPAGAQAAADQALHSVGSLASPTPPSLPELYFENLPVPAAASRNALAEIATSQLKISDMFGTHATPMPPGDDDEAAPSSASRGVGVAPPTASTLSRRLPIPPPPLHMSSAEQHTRPAVTDRPLKRPATATEGVRPSQPEESSCSSCPLRGFDMGVPVGEYAGVTMCRRFQFQLLPSEEGFAECKWKHHWGSCKYRAGHACYFCSQHGLPSWGHAGRRCPNGGAQNVKATLDMLEVEGLLLEAME